MVPTLAEPQGGSREAKLKEAEGKPTTAGDEPVARPGAGGELASDSEARRPSKTRQVEPDGTWGKMQRLTRGDLRRESVGEVSGGRSSGEAP